MVRYSEQIRTLTGEDLQQVERLVRYSDYVYQRFAPEELPLLLTHHLAAGIFRDTVLEGFLITQTINPPCAWIGGFGVDWGESSRALERFDALLAYLEPMLLARGVRHLHYSGNDTERDWLRDALLRRGFLLYRLLYAYDKFDFSIPSRGNQVVNVRAVRTADIPALLGIEEACFEPLWRYDAVSFADIAASHPYFVVAELDDRVVGYQFNAQDNEYGYLVRIAVHPSAEGQGIGIRLMAEAIDFFKRARVSRIMLNSQEDNTHAHRLYEWFGFIRMPQIGFILRKNL